MDVDDDEYDRLAYQQRLKAAVHYTVGKITEEVSADMDVSFNRQIIAVLAETVYRQSQNMARDLELFAKHARRTTVNCDDVKMLVRKNPTVLQHFQNLIDQQANASEEKKKGRKAKRKKDTDSRLDDD